MCTGLGDTKGEIMGRSKNRTRIADSNQRLRSEIPAAYTPKPVGYAKLTTLTRVDLSSPLTFTQSPRTYVRPQPKPPSQPPRSNRVGDAVRRAMPASVWKPVGDQPSKSPEKAQDPKTMVCVDRQQRREVLHAFQKTGQGGQKRPVYNWKSKIHCKKR